jgi:hypothetical protein
MNGMSRPQKDNENKQAKNIPSITKQQCRTEKRRKEKCNMIGNE